MTVVPVVIPLMAAASGLLAWAVLFVPERRGFWRRTFGVAAVLGAVAVVVLSGPGHAVGLRGVYALIDPSDLPIDVAAGLIVAVVAYVAVRIGYPIVQRHAPPVAAAADDLLDLRRYGSWRTIAAAVVGMGVAEELIFRGVILAYGGPILSVTVYTIVQVVARNPLLVVLGLGGGLVWGGLYLVTGSLLAPVLAHVLPVAAIALWPPADVRRRLPVGSA